MLNLPESVIMQQMNQNGGVIMPLSDEPYVAPMRSRITRIIQEQIPLDQWSCVDDREMWVLTTDNKQVYIPLVGGKYLKVEMTTVDSPED